MTRRSAFTVPCLVMLAAAVGCARNPVTGKSELALVSESQEIQMGQQAAQQVGQSIGYVEDQALQKYVSDIGLRMAATSERPNLPWEFHVVNDAAVNAFALPGGFIFVTRGLLSAMTNEAELASVLGHEIGHVTARHSVQQISKAQLAQLGLGVGSILSSDIAQFAGLASQGLGLLFLKYGRDAENQSDDLGFKYALNLNYDVREMDDVFQTLGRQGELAGAGRLPEWLSTHPAPENRVGKTQARLDTLSRNLDNAVRNEAVYYQRIQGLTYGDDPRQGYFEGNTFYHPDMRFQLEFPDGWQTQNTPAAVVGVSEKQDAMVQLGLAGEASPRQAAQQFLSQEGVQAGQGSTSSVNGNPAATSYFQAQTQQGVVEGIVSFVSYGGRTFGLMGYTGQGNLQRYDGTFRDAIGSFQQLRDQSKINVQPNRIEIVKLSREMTLEQFEQQYPSNIPIEELAIINQVDGPASPIPAGRMMKRIVGGTATQAR